MNSVIVEDCKNIAALPFIRWEDFKEKTILITGSTGLIGLNLVAALLYADKEKDLGIRLILPARNLSSAKALFGDPSESLSGAASEPQVFSGAASNMQILPYELGTPLSIDEPVDYIVHLASPTSSKFFQEHPADTLLANIEGTKAMLELAKEKKVEKLIFLSTMEVYGFPEKGHPVSENEVGAFDSMNARNSYPIGKIATEAILHSYFVQYQTPAVILRATQTFGPGVKYDDNRVFAQFMRCAIEKKDIVLKSKGETERSYLYTADAVSAILTALLKGVPGEAYTVANPETYCSIADMAEMVARELADGKIRVVFDIAPDIEKLGYAKTLFMNLRTDKIEGLGWKPQVGLLDSYRRMTDSVLEEK